MADLPVLRSRNTILNDLIAGFVSRIEEVNDLSEASVMRQFFEAVGQSTFKSYADIVSLISAMSVDRAVGDALYKLASDKNVPVFPARAASGSVDITDLSITKHSSMVYTGQPAPVAGSLVVYIADGSKFLSAGGTIYIGRGTINAEGPLEYATIQPEAGGAYWSVTLKPSSPTTKFHNVGESVVQGQGGVREIPMGTVVSTAEGSALSSVSFSTTLTISIMDGETSAFNVPVLANLPGPIGNVPKGAIRRADGLAFPASCTNRQAFRGGRPADDADSIRQRIKDYEAAKSKGTELALRVEAAKVTSEEEQKSVQSASISRTGTSASIVFDDGQGYEPWFSGTGNEMVVDEALGGEKELQLRNFPIAQSRIKNNADAPFATLTDQVLAVQVADEMSTHTFRARDFRVPESPTAFEVATSINNNPHANFLASTADGETRVALHPKARGSNNIQVITPESGVNANSVLKFPLAVEYSLRLYRNDEPLYQDGILARLYTLIKPNWSSGIIDGDNIIFRVDGAVQVNVPFYTSDFQAIDAGAIMSSMTSMELWVQVFNNKMPGVTASIVGNRVAFQSNMGPSGRAKLEFLGGSLTARIMGPEAVLTAQGQGSDYTLNKQTGQISLVKPLAQDEKLSAGSNFTRAKVLTTSMAAGPANGGKVWMIVDGASEPVPNGVLVSTRVEFRKAGTKLSIVGTDPGGAPQGFSLVQKGDWVLVWSNPTDPDEIKSNTGFWRVESAELGTITVDDGAGPRNDLNSPVFINSDRIAVVRSDAPMQKLSFTAGTLTQFNNQILNQIKGVQTEIVGAAIRISTLTESDRGELYIVATDLGGKSLDLPVGEIFPNYDSHFGYVATQDSEVGMPHFTLGEVDSVASDTELIVPEYLDLLGNGYDFVEFLDKWDAGDLVNLPESNANRRIFVKKFNESLDKVTALVPSYMKTGTSPIQAGDRFFLRSAYQFDSDDTLSIVLNGDPIAQNYTMPVARKLRISDHSTPTIQDFSADDLESSLDLKEPASFGDFSFNDFLVFQKSATVLTNGSGQDDYAVRFRASDFGPLGDRYRVGFVYPRSNSAEELALQITVSDLIDIGIVLPVTEPRLPNWDHTTSFTATVVTVNGRDEVTFTFRAGLEPDFSAADVSVGDVCMISSTSNFIAANKNFSAKVIDVTPNTFTVQIPTGTAVSDQLALSSIVNTGGIVTITTATPHQVVNKQRVGLWGTAPVDGFSTPLDGSFVATVINPQTFSIRAPEETPGGAVPSASYLNNTVTLNSTNHGLSEGNVVKIVGPAPFSGLTAVSEVINPNQFRCIKEGGPDPLSAANLSFDFQSYGPDISTGIDTVALSGGVVTVVTTVAHGFSTHDLVKIDSIIVDDWLVGTTYKQHDVVLYDGELFRSLANSNTGNQPDTSPDHWTVTTQDLMGTFTITVLSPTSFRYGYFNVAGDATGTNGTATRLIPTGNLARSIGGSTADNLEFGLVDTTAQDVIDFITENYDGKLEADLYNGQSATAVIDTSTEDLEAATDYVTGDIVDLKVIAGSYDVQLLSDTYVAAGADILVTGLLGGAAKYNGSYVVMDSVEVSAAPERHRLTVHTPHFAYHTTSAAATAEFTGSTPHLKMSGGINSISTTTLNSLIGVPMFTLKYPWKNAPQLNDELRLVAVTSDQLTRFWNKLIVSGLANVARIENSEYGRQLQIVTDTFGSDGSVGIAGGTANRLELALVGAASAYGGRVGSFQIPASVRKGLGVGYWIKIANTLRQNKQINLTASTNIELHHGGIEITGGPGSFQTKRSTGQYKTTKIRLERHGNFMAVIRIDGPSFDLESAGVQEGDWVRIKNQKEASWVSGFNYAIGDRVWFDGDNLNYTALAASGPAHGGAVEPGTDPGVWQVQEFITFNQGIYRVVRVFGDDCFWVEAGVLYEEMLTLGNTDNLQFYSYDSIMPGDTLTLASEALGAANMGRYTVLDDDEATLTYFPTATRLYTTRIPQEVPPTALGGSFTQVNVAEANPLHLYKRVQAVGFTGGDFATVLTSSPVLMGKFSSSLGAYIELMGKLGYEETTHFGLDSYKYYRGLMREINRVIYGDVTNPLRYPGVRAAGTDVDIKPSIIRRVHINAAIRVRTNTPFVVVRDDVRNVIAGYIKGLGVGESVSLAKVVEAAAGVEGVLSVVITQPTYDATNDLIHINADEKALIINTLSDVVISILGDEEENG